jgi:DNA repair exonuclease SbcCD nuclease subunit
MKFAILGDTHLGARNASNHYSRFFNRFFREVFYPYLVKHEIKTVFQLGDLFDNRTSLSIKAYNACKEEWFGPLVSNEIEMITLLGNHDIFYKSTLDVNTPELLLKNEYEMNIKVIKEPTIYEIGGTQIALVPWICDDNRQRVFDFFSNPHMASVDICMGHFEIDGFDMMRGVPGHGGLPRTLFESFELTLSGHYHTRSYDDYHRIQYVGTPYEITFADMHDPRGFHVFDTETRKLEFIENPFTNFDRIIYNEGWTGDISKMENKAVKLVVEKKTDLYAFDRFVDSLKLANVYDLQIIENFNDLRGVELDGSVQVENSQQIIEHYIDTLTTSVNKDSLKDYMKGLYAEAITQ